MGLGLALVAGAQALEAMEPGDGAFDHPSMTSHVLLRFDALACDATLHSEFGEELPVPLRRITFVRVEPVRLVCRPPALAADVRDVDDDVREREDVRDVGSGEANHERNPTGVDQKMVFAASFPTIRGAGTREAPPFTARTLVLSMMARYRSRTPDARNRRRMI